MKYFVDVQRNAVPLYENWHKLRQRNSVPLHIHKILHRTKKVKIRKIYVSYVSMCFKKYLKY